MPRTRPGSRRASKISTTDRRVAVHGSGVRPMSVRCPPGRGARSADRGPAGGDMRFPMPVAALLAVPIAATAAKTGPEIALRAAYAVPLGDVVNGLGIRDITTGGIPLWIDVGYRFTPKLYVGLYGSYGFLFTGTCGAGDDCSQHDVRIGGNLQFHLTPDARFDPWFGIGIGYEWLSYSEVRGAAAQEALVRGLESVMIQGGLQAAVAPGLRLGPFVAVSVGTYTDGSTSGILGSSSGSLTDRSPHFWFSLGPRGGVFSTEVV